MEIRPIAHIHNDFPEKFGLPRQSGMAPHLVSEIVMEEGYRQPDAFRGIEKFSHLWLIWEFEPMGAKSGQDGRWSATVRPPKLGGNERRGVFATRSPFRPNPLGLSCVRLERVIHQNDTIVLEISGADMKDGTPVFDIKPYIPYADRIENAEGSFAQQHSQDRLEVVIPQELVGFQLKNVELSVHDSGKELCRHFGEMTFCDDGLAGPIVLSTSRVITRRLHTTHEPLAASLDLKPALTREQLDKRLIADLNANGTRIFNDALRLWLPAELISLALPQMHIEYYKRLNQINGDERRRLLAWLKGVRFTITGTHDFNEAVVTQGGVSLSEVNPKTMESRLVSGLYIVGELLDLDADTGGYNLQIAFSTGHAAGQAV